MFFVFYNSGRLPDNSTFIEQKNKGLAAKGQNMKNEAFKLKHDFNYTRHVIDMNARSNLIIEKTTQNQVSIRAYA